MAKRKPKRESADKVQLTTAQSELREVRAECGEAVARGLEARKNLPLEAIGSWAPAADRPDPVALLRAQERTRVKWLLPLRHARMAASPFAFYRGAAKVMASDLGSAPSTQLKAQLCGDSHLANFGVFGTPERRLIFDVNDFDETIPGPWEWDVKRLVASLVVAARDRGFRKRDQRAIALRAGRAYRQAMAEFAVSSPTDIFYASISAEDIVKAVVEMGAEKAAKLAQKRFAKAESRTSTAVYERITEVVDGRRRIKTTPPTLYDFEDIPPGTTRLTSLEQTTLVLQGYQRTLPSDRRRLLERYRIVDVAFKVVGVGSIGTRCFIVLLEGIEDGSPLFLQCKEAQASVLAPYVDASQYRNHGQRVVSGQRLMQAASDIFLGWIPGAAARGFYVRQLKDWKGAADIEGMASDAMSGYAALCGWTLARAHARSGEPLQIAAYLGDDDTFEQAMVGFAVAYADQNTLDYEAFLEAIRQGKISASEQ